MPERPRTAYNKAMIWLLVIAIIIMLTVGVAVSVLLLSSLRNEVPIVLLPRDTLAAVMQAADLEPGLSFYDLGSGTGRVVRAASRAGARSIGVENNRVLIWISRLLGTGEYHHADIAESDLTKADRVFMYLGPRVVNSLLPKLERELKTGSMVISVDYPFTQRRPEQTIKVDHAALIARTIYIYKF